MSWAAALYAQFPDEATARVLADRLGVDFPTDGTVPTGNHNYALQAPIPAPWAIEPVYDPDGDVTTPGARESGYWAMLRLNEDWPGYDETMAALGQAGVLRILTNPPVVWA